jgi:hypothetical protein
MRRAYSESTKLWTTRIGQSLGDNQSRGVGNVNFSGVSVNPRDDRADSEVIEGITPKRAHLARERGKQVAKTVIGGEARPATPARNSRRER